MKRVTGAIVLALRGRLGTKRRFQRRATAMLSVPAESSRRFVGLQVLSACGYPLTQLVVHRWGVRGAAVAECVCAGLTIRDASMVADGVPGRLRRIPAALLFAELGVGVVASLAGLPPLLSAQPADRAASGRTCAADNVRRAAVAVLFAIHTIRFGIYLRPDRGRCPGQA